MSPPRPEQVVAEGTEFTVEKPMKYTSKLSILLASALLTAGCATGAASRRPRYDFPAKSRADRRLEQWFSQSADTGSAPAQAAALDEHAPVEQLFAAAEVAYWNGDVERAGDLYLRMLQQKPSHPLNRFAAARLYSMREQMVGFRKRLPPVLRTIELGKVEPLTRVYLSLIGQYVSWHNWENSDSEKPFSADPLGFPAQWMTTPALSYWRLTDFDHKFGVEDDPHLKKQYLSPYIAEDQPVNYEPSRPFVAHGLNLSPHFDHSGIHYLETFATVAPGKKSGSRDYLLYTNFSGAARLWIDGKKVIERTEGDYGTSKRLRRVRLSPGQHRILIKFAYQSGYRDWFDVALLGDTATALDGSGLTFSRTPTADAAKGSVELLDTQKLPSQLEPALTTPEHVQKASDTALYLSANAAYWDLQPEYFDAAFKELMKRHKDFAPGYVLRAKETQTLWEVPSRIRNARALADIRHAHKLAPDSLDNSVRLIDWLRGQNKTDREVRTLLTTTRDAALTQAKRLRNVKPLVEWADFLSDQGWSESAEKAWRRVLDVDPTNCHAAGELQQLYYSRSYFPPLAKITPAHDQCADLAKKVAFARPDQDAQRLAVFRRQAKRFPYDSSAQTNYADELVAQGKTDQARQVLLDAKERMPWELSIWNELANRALADKGKDAAAAILRDAIDENGNSGWLQWRLAQLDNTIPLENLMHDGLAAAKADVVRAQKEGQGDTGDEAYYVLDFAARKYFKDGSSITLTHDVVRVLTKGAIDRFGEFDPPGNSRLVLARTIKQDGTTRVPQQTPGKSTLSMPGLAPGDFVETAYVQFEAPSPLSKTRRKGTRFFFRMGDISSRHSEYVIVDPQGKFYRTNDAPKAHKIDTALGSAVRFLREDSPRPRSEPSAVNWEEYLPWIQLYRAGTTIAPFEAARRSMVEQVRDSLKTSHQLDTQIAKWRKGLKPGTDAEVKGLFYKVAAWFPDPTLNALGKDASHALLERDGSPLLVLKAAYDAAGIPADIYLVKGKFQPPADYPIGEFAKYRAPLLKVQMPSGKTEWLSPSGPDAMFGSIGLAKVGQPALCVTCTEAKKEVVPAEGHRDPSRQIDVAGKLDADGTLHGTMTMTFNGIRGYVVRSALRKRADKATRQKFIDLVISNLLPGASLESYEISDEHHPDQPLVIRAQFTRRQFARQVRPGVMQVETALFREAVASAYAGLATRTTPLMVRYQRDFDYAFHVKLPDGYKAKLRSQDGHWSLNSKWGKFDRSVGIAANTLGITSSINMPIERVQPKNYAKFQKWAIGVERSSLLFLTLQKK